MNTSTQHLTAAANYLRQALTELGAAEVAAPKLTPELARLTRLVEEAWTAAKGKSETGPAADRVRPSACPGCSGSGELTDDPQVLKCTSCGGIFTVEGEPITLAQALKFVGLNQPMLANAGGFGSFYFDLDVIDHQAKDVTRFHGWADRKTKRVVQWG